MTADPPTDAASGAGPEGDPDAEPEGPDSQLRAMRAVWLEMRDEEPAAGGLADLLAAARSQADVMRPPPPWWQRWLAGMRRPAALAFATVVVLIAGAVLLGRRTADETGTAAPRTGEPAVDPPGDRPEVREVREELGRATPLPSRPATAAPEPPSTPPTTATPVDSAAGPAHDRDSPKRSRAPARGPDGSSRDAGGAASVHPRPPAPPAAKAPAPPHPAGDALLLDEGFVEARRGSGSTAELIRQCESAAQRGDCDAVRRLVGQIAQTDRDYAARVGPDSAIGKCLVAQ